MDFLPILEIRTSALDSGFSTYSLVFVLFFLIFITHDMNVPGKVYRNDIRRVPWSPECRFKTFQISPAASNFTILDRNQQN